MNIENLEVGKYSNTMCVYMIVNEYDGKAYVGSTTNLKRRINRHARELNENKHCNTHLQRSWNVSKGTSFSFEILEIVEDESFLPFAELYYIEKYRRQNGVYNVSNPLNESRLLKNRNKKETQNRVNTKKLIDPKKENEKKNKEIREVIIAEFDYMFVKLKEKLNEIAFVEFSKINDFIISNINLRGKYDSDLIESNIVKVLRKYELCVRNFESEAYDRDILVSNNITIFKKAVVSKNIGDKISDEIDIARKALCIN